MAERLNILLNNKQNTPKSRLAYPSNIFDNYTDYIKFDFYKYKGPFSGDGGGDTVDVEGATNQLQIYNQSNGEQYTRYPGVSPILMYMPEDISTGYQTDWTGKGFSNVAANALRTAGAAGAGDGGALITSFVNSITTAASALPTAAAQTVATAINGVGAGDVTTEDVLQGSLGVVLNPNTELMFQGFKLRSFTLKFKMSARNLKETKDIRRIIGTFKKVSLPVFGQDPGGPSDLKGLAQALVGTPKEKAPSNTNYIGVPGLCQVSFMRGTYLHPYLPQYKVCAITEVSVNYTPDGSYATYGGKNADDVGAPVAVELALTFSETKLIYSNEINPEGVSY